MDKSASAVKEEKPGPGAYSPSLPVPGPHYSMGKSKKDAVEASPMPGPGSYQPQEHLTSGSETRIV